MRLSALSSPHAFKPTHYQPKLTPQVNHTQRYGETTPDDKDKLVFKPPSWEKRVEATVGYLGENTPDYPGKVADLANIIEYILGKDNERLPSLAEFNASKQQNDQAKKANLITARQNAQKSKTRSVPQEWLIAHVTTEGNVVDRKNANHIWLEQRKRGQG